jgi:cytoplasmic iron level regulating protein YaaA (DUF328/UPF0246 family)
MKKKRIVLISCGSQKLDKKTKAENLYTGTLFKLSLQFAKKQKHDEIFILSAKHGLLGLNDEIEPYDVTLNNMPEKDRKSWADGVLKQLNNKFSLKNDHFIILAGSLYRQFLLPELYSYEIPLEGMSIGKQLRCLKRKLNDG